MHAAFLRTRFALATAARPESANYWITGAILLLLVIYIYNIQDFCSLPGLLERAFVRKGQCQFTTTTGRRPLVATGVPAPYISEQN